MDYERRQTVIIVNPRAHKLPGRKRRREAEEWLRLAGWGVQWLETAGPGDATHLAAASAARGLPLIFVCGGDGTLREAAAGLAGTQTALAVIPGGTVNLWARETGLLRRPVDAVQLAVNGERRQVDLGRAGDQYFLLMAGYGIDAAVTRRVSLGVKGRLGAAAYALAAAREALSYRATPLTLKLDDETLSGDVLMVLASNTRNYAGLTRIAAEAKVDDGLLDVCVYQGRGKLDIIAHAARTLLRLHRKAGGVTYRKVKRLRFQWEQPLPVQLDGDPIEGSPEEVTVAPGALWVAVPAGGASQLFSRPPDR